MNTRINIHEFYIYINKMENFYFQALHIIHTAIEVLVGHVLI